MQAVGLTIPVADKGAEVSKHPKIIRGPQESDLGMTLYAMSKNFRE